MVWIKYNPNPVGRVVGDCVPRAISAALGVDWETAYDLVSEAGRNMGDMPSSDSVWGAVLREHGFYRESIPNKCPNCYTVRDFCRDNPIGIYVLGFGGHVATVINGDLLDAWDSSKEIPQFVWYKRR